MRVIKGVHIVNHQDIKVVKSDLKSWEVVYKRKDTDCAWMLRSIKRKIQHFF